MKKLGLIIALFAFTASFSVANTITSTESIEIVKGEKDGKGDKKKKCKKQCAKACCTKEEGKATAKKSCSKSKKACCAKKKAAAPETPEAPATK